MTRSEAYDIWQKIDDAARVQHPLTCDATCDHTKGTPIVFGYEKLTELVLNALVDASKGRTP